MMLAKNENQLEDFRQAALAYPQDVEVFLILEYSLFYRALLQKRPTILRSLLTKATPKQLSRIPRMLRCVFNIGTCTRARAHTHTHTHMYLCGWAVCVLEYAHIRFFEYAHTCFFGISRVVRSLKYLNLHIDMVMHIFELFVSSNMRIYVFLVSPGCWGLWNVWIST